MAKKFNIHDWQAKQRRLNEVSEPDMSISNDDIGILDKLKKKNEADYNKVEKIMEKHFSAKKQNEISTTGGGASFQAGSGEGYATPHAFKKKRKNN